MQVWARRHPSLPVAALPYSADMHLLMQCASAVVTRGGTGTTSEAIISGCPVIFNALGYYMPQEWITVRYARRHGFSQEIHRADDLPAILARWAGNPEILRKIRASLAACCPAAHPTDILRMVATLGGETNAAPPAPQKQAARIKDHAEPGPFFS